MRVYILSYDLGYDGDQLIGVYDSEKKAKGVAKLLGRWTGGFLLRIRELNASQVELQGDVDYIAFQVVKGEVKESHGRLKDE